MIRVVAMDRVKLFSSLSADKVESVLPVQFGPGFSAIVSLVCNAPPGVVEISHVTGIKWGWAGYAWRAYVTSGCSPILPWVGARLPLDFVVAVFAESPQLDTGGDT